MKESDFQRKVVLDLKDKFNGCYVMKTDANAIQGMPDLLILYKNKWAALECKQDEKSKHRPNQDYRIDQMNKLSFARFIFPENKQTVFKELTEFFK